MPGGAVNLAGPTDLHYIEAPVTIRAYLLCAFAAFGGIFLQVSLSFTPFIRLSQTAVTTLDTSMVSLVQKYSFNSSRVPAQRP
jgi:hypothetical protein